MYIMPEKIIDWILCPFNPTNGSFELLKDYRNMVNIIFCLFLIIGIKYSEYKKNEIFCGIIKNNYLLFIVLFVFLSYYINAALFAMDRFIMYAVLFYGIIAYSVLYCICRKYYISIPIFIILSTVMYAVQTVGTVTILPLKQRFNLQSVIDTNSVNIENDSYVFLFNAGNSIIVPFLNPNAKYISGFIPQEIVDKYYTPDVFLISDLGLMTNSIGSEYLYNKIHNIMMSDSKIYVISFEEMLNNDLKDLYISALNEFSSNTRKISNCKNTNTKFFGIDIYSPVICEFNKKDIN